MILESYLQECTNEELVKIITLFDELLEMDEHLFKTSPYLEYPYQSFKFHNRMVRSLAHSCLKMSYEEAVKLNYPNHKITRSCSDF
jgi:hypothetical protein